MGQVKAYLSEVEASFREWERFAVEAKARIEIAEEKASIEIAEEKARGSDEVDEAMIAIFAAKDRILELGLLQVEQIEAEARERARVDYEDAAGVIIRVAEEQARRIVQEAREDADRVVGAARDEAEGLIAQAQANAAMSEDRSGDALVVDLTDRDGVDEADDDGSLRRTRYERRSAALPSLGEDASKILRSLEGLRKDPNTDSP
jgi:hypothetical protein